jgi:hypothetical protein
MAAAVPNLPSGDDSSPAAVVVEVYSQVGCDRPVVDDLTKALDRAKVKWSCALDRELLYLFRSAGYFLGDEEPSVKETAHPSVSAASFSSSSTSGAESTGKRQVRFHSLRDLASGVGMVLAGLAALLVGLAIVGHYQHQLQRPPLRGDRQHPYEKIPHEVVLQ